MPIFLNVYLTNVDYIFIIIPICEFANIFIHILGFQGETMVIKRILSLLDEKGFKMADLCRYIGINTSTMANWKTRNTDPPVKYLIPICEFLGVSSEYLLTGQDSKNKLSKEDKEWLELIHSLPADVRLEMKGEMKGYLKYMEKSVAADGSKTGTDNLGK